jgi:hypothetical protein
MMRLLFLILGLLLLVFNGSESLAESQKAKALRQANGLVAFTPSEKFLAGNFMADEANPTCIFGTVQAFAASRACSTTWFVEEDAQKSPAGPGSPDKPLETTVYLEEDCPNQVVYYVFMDQSNMNPQQWMEWRRQFHKSKADPMFASAKAKLERACQDGCEVSAELRFIQKNGELLAKSPEKVLRGDLKFAPIYDLNQQKKISK